MPKILEKERFVFREFSSLVSHLSLTSACATERTKTKMTIWRTRNANFMVADDFVLDCDRFSDEGDGDVEGEGHDAVDSSSCVLWPGPGCKE